MENTETSVASTATRAWHEFLERMRQPSATEFVKSIKKFIASLSNNAPDPETDSASIQQFLSNMEIAFKHHPLWNGRTEEELDSAGEGLEKYMMTKLFTRVFASHPDDIKTDNELYKKSALIHQFIQPEHLEIPQVYQDGTLWLEAQKELQKINNFKAPRDKLACILSCCKLISNSLLNASISQNPPGADDFFPVLIYVILKANPPQLHSNLMYIQRYRNKSRLVGEASYVFTNMLSAESFILNIDAKALSMDDIEFEKNMEFAQTLISGLYEDYRDGENMQSENGQSQSQNIVESKLKEVPSVTDLENKGASMLVTAEKASEKFQNFPFLFSEAGDLRVGDVEELLNGYKQLVFKYVCLAKGLGMESRISGELGDVGTIEGGGKGFGRETEAPPSETQIGDGTAEMLESNRGTKLDDGVVGRIEDSGKRLGVSSETQIGVETVDSSERDAQVDVRVDGGLNDDVGASTPESVV
ncbi:vacuolar protein sorting-associated protein 9A-like protein [Tanacetum coccineum]